MLAWQATTNGRLFAFLARTDSPAKQRGLRLRRPRLLPTMRTRCGAAAPATRRSASASIPKSASCRAGRIGSVESRYDLSYQPKRWPWIRRFSSHPQLHVYLDLENQLESTFGHLHVFEIQPLRGGRFGYTMDMQQDRPRQPFTVYQDVDRTARR